MKNKNGSQKALRDQLGWQRVFKLRHTHVDNLRQVWQTKCSGNASWNCVATSNVISGMLVDCRLQLLQLDNPNVQKKSWNCVESSENISWKELINLMEISEEDEKNFLLQSMADIDHGSKFEPISKFNLGFKI